MYTYFYRIRDRYPVRMVSALAIFTGQDGSRMPGRYSYEYRGTKLIYEYPTLSILDYSDTDLEMSDNPFAQVIVAAKMRLREGKISEDELLNIKLLTARRLQEKGFNAKKIRAIFTFLRNYVLFEKPETNRKFDNVFNETKKNNVMNTDDLIRMIAQEEITETFIENLLKETDFTVEKIASLTNVSVKVVNEVKSQLSEAR